MMQSLKKIAAAVATTAALLGAAPAQALVVNGALFDQFDASGGYIARTVDFYNFSTGGGNLVVDVFASGVLPGGLFDSMIWVFRKDATLGTDDLVAQNDDSLGFSDGSVSSLDSLLSLNLTAGNYILAIGSCCDSGGFDIIDGLQGETFNFNPATTFVANEYRLNISGDFALTTANNVPEPASLSLLGLALLGFAAARRKIAG